MKFFTKCFAAGFIWSVILAVLVQKLVLPVFLPEMHEGNGLLAGRDSALFHELAKAHADEIRELGWSHWQISPYSEEWNPNAYENMEPAGMLAVLYVFLPSQPWVLIPVNAFFHGAAFALLVGIFRFVSENAKQAVFAALPFLVFPSALTWYAQIHRDGMFIFGVFSVLLGLLFLLRSNECPLAPLSKWLGGFTLLLLGFLCLEFSRGYAIPIIILAMIPASLILLLDQLLAKRAFAVGLAVLVMAILGGGVFALANTTSESIQKDRFAEEVVPEERAEHQAGVWSGFGNLVQQQVEGINEARERFVGFHPDAGTLIDEDVRYSNLSDLLRYAPRAIWIGVLAPFPNAWGSPGDGIERFVASGEMLCAYLFFIGIPFLFLNSRKVGPVTSLIIAALVPILVFSLATPVVGALYRFRYGFWQILLGLGILGWCALSARIERRRRKG